MQILRDFFRKSLNCAKWILQITAVCQPHASRAHRVILSSDSRTFKRTEKDPYRENPRPYKDDCACKCNNIKYLTPISRHLKFQGICTK